MNEFILAKRSQAIQSNIWCSTMVVISELPYAVLALAPLHCILLYSKDMTNSGFEGLAEFHINYVPDQICFHINSHCPLVTAGAHSCVVLVICPVPIHNHVANSLVQ